MTSCSHAAVASSPPSPLRDPGPTGCRHWQTRRHNTVTLYRPAYRPDRQPVPHHQSRRCGATISAASSSRRRSGWPTAGRCRARGSFRKSTGNYNNTSATATPETAHRIQRSEYRSSLPTVPRGAAHERQHAHRQDAGNISSARWALWRQACSLHVRSNVHPHCSHARASARVDRTLFIEPRGSQRYDGQPQFNFKLEKQFRVRTERAAGRDLRRFQPLQQRSDQSRRARVRAASYFEPRGVVCPRRFRIGAVYRF